MKFYHISVRYMFADFRMKVCEESVEVKYMVVELLSTGKHLPPFYCRPFHPIVKVRIRLLFNVNK